MMTFTALNSATQLAETIYNHFLEVVLEGHVIRHKIGLNSENIQKEIDAGRYEDTRYIKLMIISGKGGYTSDATEFAKRSCYTNITLLDHLLSVGRGAMLIYVLDCINKNPEMDPQLLKTHLVILLSLGFMHDVDKIAGISRSRDLTIEEVQRVAESNGVTDFCKHYDIELSARQWLGLIARVEGTQAHRYTTSEAPPRGIERLPIYVGYADKLDGTWLLDESKGGGLQGVLERLEKDMSIEIDLFEYLKPLTLRDPHHPFLLDELQHCISLACRRIAGIPPLIETHHDGELCMLMPKNEYEKIVKKGLNHFYNRLPFQLKVAVPNRGIPSLYNSQPKLNELHAFMQEMIREKQLSELFQVKYEISQMIFDELVDLLDEVDVEPKLPTKNHGLVTLFADLEKLGDAEKYWLRKTALLTLLVNLKITALNKEKIPSSNERKKQLLLTVDRDPPSWILNINDAHSQRVLLSLWAGVLAEENSVIEQKIFGLEGLLEQWLEGTTKIKGFRNFITGDGEKLIANIRTRFESLLGQKLLKGDHPEGEGRCLFTAEPVPFGNIIKQADGLYEVKISAFSGRDNRPETISNPKAHTNMSATSLAEHIIRSEIHQDQGGKRSGVPSIISSPSTMGLFGGLAITSDKAMPAMSVYDLSRQEIKKGLTLKGAETYSGRWRIARFERMPEKGVEQIDMLRLLLNAALRTGRPLHLFRGLPLKQNAFFYFDAMPRVLIELIGSRSLRIEQIPEAIERLEIAGTIGETPGLGYDILTFYAMGATRFKAICLACGVLEEKGKNGNVIQALKSQHEEYMKGAKKMNSEDGALVQLGRAAAGIQRRPGGMGSNSGSEERLVFNLCMDAAVTLLASAQNDRQSLINGIAGELEYNLVRKGKAAAREYRDDLALVDGCFKVAELFVDKVWLGALKGRVPSHKTRRMFTEIYRMSFLQTHRENSKLQKEVSQ